jgi:PIN domain nuclease of toxin-antitoxin system
VKLLLDTHIALWAIADSPRLPQPARILLLDPANVCWISAASVWEIAIKHSLGRGDMPLSGAQALAWFRESGFRLLDITPEHTAATGTLAPLHADPFDRLLVAQALNEPLRLLTHDPQVARYSDTVMLV